MKLSKANCPSCGAPISIPENLDFINCASCGSFFAIEHGEGYVALKTAEKIARAIEDSGKGTQDVIRESTQVTRIELQHMQITQEISAAQMRLTSIQAEIRTLERETANKKAKSQLPALRTSEYHTMDRIRVLNGQLPTPPENDLKAWIELMTVELGWINAELGVVTQGAIPQSRQIIQFLTSRKAELTNKIHAHKIQQIKAQLPSFKVKDLPLDDQAEAAKLLALLAADEQIMRNSRGTPEGSSVYYELTQRKKVLRDAWTQMERARWDSILQTPDEGVDRANIAALQEHLGFIDRDLSNLNQAGNNPVVQELQEKLLDDKKRTQKQIQSLEKEIAKVSRPKSPHGSGFFAVFLAGVAAFFAGIGILFHSLLSGRAASGQAGQTPPTQDNVGMLGTTSPKVVTNSVGKPKGNSVGLGCLSGFIIMFIVAIIGFVGMMIAFPNTSNASGSSDVGGPLVGSIFLTVTIGLVLGTWVFLRIAAPNTTIRRFGSNRKINITPSKSGQALNNPKAVKMLVGITSCLILWSLFMTLAGFTTIPGSSLPAIIVLIGFFLGPIMAITIASRTEFSKDQAV